MISERVVNKALEEALKNPSCREVYESAPTEKCRRYWALNFCESAWCMGEVGQEVHEEASCEIKKLFDEFGVEDWEHIKKNCGSYQFKAVCSKRIAALRGQ